MAVPDAVMRSPGARYTLAGALEKTAEEPEWARERAAFGVEFMKTDFRLSNQADKLAVLYNGLLRSGSKTGH